MQWGASYYTHGQTVYGSGIRRVDRPTAHCGVQRREAGVRGEGAQGAGGAFRAQT